jgi:hypothetical protein
MLKLGNIRLVVIDVFRGRFIFWDIKLFLMTVECQLIGKKRYEVSHVTFVRYRDYAFYLGKGGGCNVNCETLLIVTCLIV